MMARPRPPKLLPFLLLSPLLLLIASAPAACGSVDRNHEETQLFNHDFTLPQDNVARGVAYRGDGRRIRSVLEALKAGRAVHLGVIGGSITWGHGVKVGEEDWFSVTAANLRRAFPRANVTHYSGAMPATTTSFAVPVVAKLVKPEADLVFVEYTVNDGWEDEPPIARSERARTFERALRALLTLPRNPSVVLMHSFPSNASRAALPFWASEEDAYGVLAQYYGLPSLSVRDALWHEYQAAARLLRRAQDEADARERARTGNDTASAPLVDPSGVLPERLRGFGTWKVHQLDERHPTQRGQRMMADLVVGLLQQEYVGMAVRRALRGAGRPLSGEDEEEKEEGGGGVEEAGQEEAALLGLRGRGAPLPPPMFEGNGAETVALQCLLGRELATVAEEGLAAEDADAPGGGDGGGGGDDSKRRKQWRLVNDGDARKQKWGLAADEPGAELVLVLDTRVAGRGTGGGETGALLAAATDASSSSSSSSPIGDDARRHDRRRRRSLSSWWSWWETAARDAAVRDAPRPSSPAEGGGAEGAPPLEAELVVGLVRSWRGQGSADLSCSGGCRCDPARLVAFDASRKVTQNYVKRVAVSQAARCRVSVRLPDGDDGRGPDGGRHVKLVGVTVASSAPGAAEAAAAAGGGC